MQLDGGFGRVVVDWQRETERDRERVEEEGGRKGCSANTQEKYPLHECTPTFRQWGMSGRDGRFRAVENGVGEDVDM